MKVFKNRIHSDIYRKDSGFTLVELMATIAVLALIVLIAIPSIGNIMENAESKTEAASIEMAEKSGALAHVDGLAYDDEDLESYTLETLTLNGYLDIDDDNSINVATSYVAREGNGNTFVYQGGSNNNAGDSSTVVELSDFEYMTIAEWAESLGSSWDELGQEAVDTYGSPDALMLMKYNGSDKNIEIQSQYDGNNVVVIGDNAFANKDLTNVVLPDTIVMINSGAFAGNALTEVVIPMSVTMVGPGAFSDNESLYRIVFENSMIGFNDTLAAPALDPYSTSDRDNSELTVAGELHDSSAVKALSERHGYTFEALNR